jgi:hypothetical protein
VGEHHGISIYDFGITCGHTSALQSHIQRVLKTKTEITVLSNGPEFRKTIAVGRLSGFTLLVLSVRAARRRR